MEQVQVTVLTNAIVDILSHIDEAFLQQYPTQYTQHRLISEQEADHLYSIIPPTIQQSGGSLANTMFSLSATGIKGCCMAKVFDDAFGKVFLHDMVGANIRFPVPVGEQGKTARSIILIHPNAERVMNTFLGDANQLSPQELCDDTLKNTDYFCGEAYFWPNRMARDTLFHAVNVAKAAGSKIIFCLSAEGCIKGHEQDLIDYIKNHADIVIGNIIEFQALFSSKDTDYCIRQAKTLAPLSVVTLGKKGSVIQTQDKTLTIKTAKPVKIIDSTGAGDAYTAGFIYGLVHKMPLEKAGEYASLFAAQCIGQTGARPCPITLKKSIKGEM